LNLGGHFVLNKVVKQTC